jgi:hypothetical protein
MSGKYIRYSSCCLSNTPPAVPAQRVVGVAGSITKALTYVLLRPSLTALHSPPPFVILNISVLDQCFDPVELR